MSERDIVSEPDPTSANAALWQHYLDDRLSRIVDPLGIAPAVQAFGASIASWYARSFGELIDYLYAENARQVSEFVRESGASATDEPALPESVPSWFAATAAQTPAPAGAAHERKREPVGAIA